MSRRRERSLIQRSPARTRPSSDSVTRPATTYDSPGVIERSIYRRCPIHGIAASQRGGDGISRRSQNRAIRSGGDSAPPTVIVVDSVSSENRRDAGSTSIAVPVSVSENCAVPTPSSSVTCDHGSPIPNGWRSVTSTSKPSDGRPVNGAVSACVVSVAVPRQTTNSPGVSISTGAATVAPISRGRITRGRSPYQAIASPIRRKTTPIPVSSMADPVMERSPSMLSVVSGRHSVESSQFGIVARQLLEDNSGRQTGEPCTIGCRQF